ncbi:hypothetical protein KAU33_14160 [Candidatus Dependentiae bacterium]|nr:hypothetical protein [Candidatus Dependentiae bacterium]
MNNSEKLKLEKIYSLVFLDKLPLAIQSLKQILISKESSIHLKEIVQFKIADILFQLKKYNKSKKEFNNFIKGFPHSQLVDCAKERLKFIQEQF